MSGVWGCPEANGNEPFWRPSFSNSSRADCRASFSSAMFRLANGKRKEHKASYFNGYICIYIAMSIKIDSHLTLEAAKYIAKLPRYWMLICLERKVSDTYLVAHIHDVRNIPHLLHTSERINIFYIRKCIKRITQRATDIGVKHCSEIICGKSKPAFGIFRIFKLFHCHNFFVVIAVNWPLFSE